MIPKIIHYCWFGNSPKSEKIKSYMETWRKVLPDYEFKEWTEKDLSLFSNSYVEQAYQAKKWAFVSDVCRLYALYSEGGIYLDTDVEVRRSFDTFLEYDFFIGTEKNHNSYNLATAVIGASKNNHIIKEMLELYSDQNFIKSDGSFDTTPNPRRLSSVMLKYGLQKVCDNQEPYVTDEKNAIFPATYFSSDSAESYAVHHFEASWVDAWALKKKAKITLGKKYNLCLYKYKKWREAPFDYSSKTVLKLCDINYKKNKYLITLESK